MSKVHAHSHEITNKPLRVRTTKTLWLPTWKTDCNAEKCASDVKKMKNCRKENFEGEANSIQLDKEDTRRSNWNSKCVFNILNLLLFLLRLISLLVKYDFILRYEAWVNAIRTPSCIENFPQISAKPIAFQQNLLGKLSRNRPFSLPIVFQQNWPQKFPWNSREIGLFSANLSQKIPRNLTFFPWPTRSPASSKFLLF